MLTAIRKIVCNVRVVLVLISICFIRCASSIRSLSISDDGRVASCVDDEKMEAYSVYHFGGEKLNGMNWKWKMHANRMLRFRCLFFLCLAHFFLLLLLWMCIIHWDGRCRGTRIKVIWTYFANEPHWILNAYM